MRNKLADELQVTPGVSVTQRFTAANSPAGDEKHEQPARRGTGESQVRPPSPVPVAASLSDKPHVDWSTLAGFRFLLACYVMFMHIGSNDSWDAFSNLRQFPWHVHTFFTLAGFYPGRYHALAYKAKDGIYFSACLGNVSLIWTGRPAGLG